MDFPLPANAVAEQVVYMLRHSGARILLASDEEQVGEGAARAVALPEPERGRGPLPHRAERHGLLSLEQMIGQGGGSFDDMRPGRRAPRR